MPTLSLNLPDFRASERTFQLLSQVAGRAGRGQLGGQVIIQTYNPNHYAIQAAARHDYGAFYEQEINFRRQFKEPPFTQLAALTFVHTNDNRCQEEAEKIARYIIEERDAKGIPDLSMVGLRRHLFIVSEADTIGKSFYVGRIYPLSLKICRSLRDG